MKFEQGPHFDQLSRQRAREVLRIAADRNCTIPAAIRQTLINERVTDERDVQRIMKELGPVIPAVERQLIDEGEIIEEVRRDDAIEEEMKRQRSTNEDVITPDGEDLSDRA